MFIKIIENEPVQYSFTQLREDNPNVSFPSKFTKSFLADWGLYEVVEGEKPDYDSLTQELVSSFKNVEGVWTRVYVDSNLPQEVAESNVRKKRNNLLRNTDWRFRSDMNPSQDWVDYCQQLRDITTQSGFPYSVVWPAAPN